MVKNTQNCRGTRYQKRRKGSDVPLRRRVPRTPRIHNQHILRFAICIFNKKDNPLFTVLKTEGRARRGVFTSPHGTAQTPVFMNVGTSAAIKGAVSTMDLYDLGCQIELSNTYHLHIRPGDDVIRDMGVEFRFGVEVGKDVTIDDLRKQGYKAFFIAIGMQGGRLAGVPGEDAAGVMAGVD